MRLIDADELIKDRVENDPVRIAVECAPTAFDKEKVIEELRGEIHLTVYDPMIAGRYIKKKRAIEIVKKCGIEFLH